MSTSPTDSYLLAPLFSEERISRIFSDDAYLSRLVQVEVALINAQARLGIVPAQAAAEVTAAADATRLDRRALREATARDGFPVSELVRQLREQVGGDAADYVHWGATTQDIIDTALV